MLIFSKKTDITKYISSEKNKNPYISIGFVPTMGALHEGHLSLIKKSKSENNLTVCSIYVNPLQFNDKNDYEKYPRNFSADIELLKSIDCDIAFIPSIEEMIISVDYPDYDLLGLDSVMEGKARPGHFKGVVYIVKKLFDIIKPDKAYFGLKDYQQYLIIKYIVKLFKCNILIIGCPIVRDSDGLALSSRNLRLLPENRLIAPVIFKILKDIKGKFNDLSITQLKELAVNRIDEINKVSEQQTSRYELIKLDYLEIVDKDNLVPISDDSKNNAIACIAVFLGEIRLIDNIFLS